GGGVVIRDDRIADRLREDLEAKNQWPDPWLSLNPFFDTGGAVHELVQEGLLHEETARIFQKGKTEHSTTCKGERITFHRHQRQAVDAARTAGSSVSPPGTGLASPWATSCPSSTGSCANAITKSPRDVRASGCAPSSSTR